MLDKISPSVKTFEIVLSVTSSIVDIASRISSSSFKLCFRKLLSELFFSKLERLSITSRCLCSISLIIPLTDLPFETIHFWRRFVTPPNAETIINNGSSLSLRIDITLFIDFESATDVPPNFRT